MLLDIPGASKSRGLSLTPLIDVVFILLLFFMLSTNFMQWQELPLSATKNSANAPETIVHVKLLTDTGDIEAAGQQLNLQTADALSGLIATQPEDAVYAVHVSATVSTQTFINLSLALERAGASVTYLAQVLEETP